MSIKIALVGNPNSGKTTLFNALTGSNQYVGNWPGVTVEKKVGACKHFPQAWVTDLPGIYSLSPYTPEERITRNFLLNERPDVILNIVDATNLERNLYLTTQLLELEIPLVIAFNQMDLAESYYQALDIESIAHSLGCLATAISAAKGQNIEELMKQVLYIAKSPDSYQPSYLPYSLPIESALAQIQGLSGPLVSCRFEAVKILEREVRPTGVEPILKTLEDRLKEDTESLIAKERYDAIEQRIASFAKRRPDRDNFSERIDRILTHRLLALPLFAFIMWLVYFISVSTVGTWGTDWVNDVLFGQWVPTLAKNLLESVGTAAWLQSLLLDGVIAGVGAVLGFLPQLMVLFFMLSLLEESGYMSRIAFILDRVFRRFGLSGKSFIPILIGTGCSVLRLWPVGPSTMSAIVK